MSEGCYTFAGGLSAPCNASTCLHGYCQQAGYDYYHPAFTYKASHCYSWHGGGLPIDQQLEANATPRINMTHHAAMGHATKNRKWQTMIQKQHTSNYWKGRTQKLEYYRQNHNIKANV